MWIFKKNTLTWILSPSLKLINRSNNPRKEQNLQIMVNNQLDCLQYLWQLACQSSAMAWYQHRLRRRSIIRIIHIIHVIHYPHVFTQARISGPFQHQYQPQQLGQVTLLTEILFPTMKFIFFNWSMLWANETIFFRHLGVCHADDLFYMWGTSISVSGVMMI